ncbi:MAG: UPF0182 family protein, partial [Tepidiformaceae bacterium]
MTAGSILLFLIVLPGLVDFAASWLWMREVGFQTVLVREITTRLALVVGVGLAAYGFLRLNLRIARGRNRLLPVSLNDNGIMNTGLGARPRAGANVPLPVVSALFFALFASRGLFA